MQAGASPGGGEERVKRMLEVIDVKDVESLSRADTIIALGKLLSVKVKDKPTVHEVTKEVRRALELAVRNPLREDEKSVIATAIYTNPPFESGTLNETYRVLLNKLLEETLKTTKGLNPMWRKRLINLTIENIYIAAASNREYRKKIFEELGGEGR